VLLATHCFLHRKRLYPVHRGSYVPSDEALLLLLTRFVARRMERKLLENLMFAFPRPLAHVAHAAQTCFQEKPK
jgi:hypothetical protein